MEELGAKCTTIVETMENFHDLALIFTYFLLYMHIYILYVVYI